METPSKDKDKASHPLVQAPDYNLVFSLESPRDVRSPLSIHDFSIQLRDDHIFGEYLTFLSKYYTMLYTF